LADLWPETFQTGWFEIKYFFLDKYYLFDYKVTDGVKEIFYNNSILKTIFSFLFILISLTYCAARQEVSIRQDENEILRKRINEYWQYHINANPANIEKAYQLELPEFRERVSVLEYAQRYKLIKYMEAEVLEIDVKEKEGKGKVKLSYMMFLKNMPKPTWTKIEDEEWIKRGEIWYHIPEGFGLAKK
jgi:hypothetical protein